VVYEGGWQLAGAKVALFHAKTQLNDALISIYVLDNKNGGTNWNRRFINF